LDVYNKRNIVIADGVNLFPAVVLDGRKCLALVLWPIFLSSEGVYRIIHCCIYVLQWKHWNL